MHAFLITGIDKDGVQKEIENLSKRLDSKILSFPLAKIEDVRSLNDLLSLSFDRPTLIVSEQIENATEEALNALLKNLEEPQENIYFALTASSTKKVLPTIVSRCQIIKIANQKIQITNEDELEKFIRMDSSQRLAFFDRIKDRAEAINFVERLIFFLHTQGELKNMELLIKTRTCLEANGTVNLHLTNLAIQYAE